MWNTNLELPDGSYILLDIEDYFEYIMKKQDAFTDNLQIKNMYK